MSKSVEIKNVPASLFQTDAKDSRFGNTQRRLSLEISDVAALPELVFGVKASQSPNPERAGKIVFKHISYKANAQSSWSVLAPEGATLQTPASELKQRLVGLVQANPEAEVRVTVDMKGKFANIQTPEGNFVLFDDEQFPETEGRPPYFLDAHSVVTAKLTEAVAEKYGTTYFQVDLSSDFGPDKLFQRRGGQARVWGEAAPEEAPILPANATPDAPSDSAW